MNNDKITVNTNDIIRIIRALLKDKKYKCNKPKLSELDKSICRILAQIAATKKKSNES